MKLDFIKYIVIDVDGTMTDGGIYYDENGNELKKFCTKDAAGFFIAKRVGIKTVILTGRECQATTKRMKELQVDYLFQNITDKYVFLKKFMQDNKIKKEELAYIGDDLNDLSSMSLAGFIGCPKDSCKEIQHYSNYISKVNGGAGAVRDIIGYVLTKRKQWRKYSKEVYSGI